MMNDGYSRLSFAAYCLGTANADQKLTHVFWKLVEILRSDCTDFEVHTHVVGLSLPHRLNCTHHDCDRVRHSHIQVGAMALHDWDQMTIYQFLTQFSCYYSKGTLLLSQTGRNSQICSNQMVIEVCLQSASASAVLIAAISTSWLVVSVCRRSEQHWPIQALKSLSSWSERAYYLACLCLYADAGS